MGRESLPGDNIVLWQLDRRCGQEFRNTSVLTVSWWLSLGISFSVSGHSEMTFEGT